MKTLTPEERDILFALHGRCVECIQIQDALREDGRKYCAYCDAVKSLDAFPPNPSAMTRDGRCAACRLCVNRKRGRKQKVSIGRAEAVRRDNARRFGAGRPHVAELLA